MPHQPAGLGNLAVLAATVTRTSSVLLALLDDVREIHHARLVWPTDELARDRSLLTLALRDDSVWVSSDIHADLRTTHHPFRLEDPETRFFAAAPVVVDELVVGAVCVRDGVARGLSAEEQRGLEAVAVEVAHYLAPAETVARDLLDALLDTLPDSVYFKNRRSQFLRISRSLAASMGLADPSDAIGKSDADFFGYEHAREARDDERHIVDTGEPVIGKLERELALNGQDRWVSTTKVPLRNQLGTVIGTLGVSRDVTLLKQFEDDLAVARDAALESARLKSEFLANMSHEIRTPLNAVVGMSGLLLDTDLDSEQRDFATTIRTSADLLLGIINDILDVSKMDAGKMHIETIDFDLTQIVEEAADLLADRAQSKGIELVTWMQPDVPRWLCGDPGRIRQVLVNLVGNAVKFTDRGEVVVQVSAENTLPASLTLRVEIRDTGIGIAADAQDKLFASFTQADGSTTRRYGGTGLGLAICKRLVTLMGGDIGFTSRVEVGTTFWFTLPLGRHAGPVAADVPDTVSLDGARVLIVDDNDANREFLRHQAAAWRMRHDSATNGPDALTKLRHAPDAGDPYDIVILDMQMPDMDGMAVARAIKSDQRLRDTRVVVLTSLAYHADEGHFRRAGIAAYLTKPVKQSRLFDSLIGAISVGDAPRRPVRERVPAAAPLESYRGIRVLLAEDNTVNQKVALRQLKKLGIDADAVGDGEEVLQSIAHTPYDVILMDCQMPNLDGYEATRRIRQQESLTPSRRRMHIIALTAHAMPGDRDLCLQAGMDDYISKPMRLDELGNALGRAGKRE
jgi:PAS domain S-box-containing protein